MLFLKNKKTAEARLFRLRSEAINGTWHRPSFALFNWFRGGEFSLFYQLVIIVFAIVTTATFIISNRSATAHTYTEWWHDDCCSEEMEDCIARPDHGYFLCRRGHKAIAGSLEAHCWGVGCIGSPTGVCEPSLSDETCTDSDGDGLIDLYETSPAGRLPDMGANPMRKDLFIEVDCLVSDGNNDGDLNDPVDHSHCPREDAIRDVVQAFANAPVGNPDGTTGIQLHIDTGALYGSGVVTPVPGVGGVTGNYGDLRDHYGIGGGDQIPEAGNEIIDWDGSTGRPGTSFYDLKNVYYNYREWRFDIFRYAIFGHQVNARRVANDCTSGWAEGMQCDDFLVTLGGTNIGGGPCWGIDANGFSVGNRNQQAGTFMHELGHCLDLGHGGGDHVNNKPNYLSVMNYSFQSCNVPANLIPYLPGGCDYSRFELPFIGVGLDQKSLDECLGIGLGFGPVDWDGDGILEGEICAPPNTVNVSVDINGDDFCVDQGPNGVLDSAPSGDDVIIGSSIRDGNNLTCDSTAIGDDVQRKSVGSSQPNPLNGFDDWENINYSFTTSGNFEDGVAAPVFGADPETLEKSKKILADKLQPFLVLEMTGPAKAARGETIVYSIKVKNVGRGPAFSTIVFYSDPDLIDQIDKVGLIKVGSETTLTHKYTVPSELIHKRNILIKARARYKDIVGNSKSTDEIYFKTRVYNRQPVADAGPDQTVPVKLNCTATVTLDGSGSSDLDNDPLTYTWTKKGDRSPLWRTGTATGAKLNLSLPLGTHGITLIVNDGMVDSKPDTVTISVIDTTPPEISLTCNPNTLWRPNHQMVPVTVDAYASDNCDPEPVCHVTSVKSNEPQDGLGDGDTAPDWEITDGLTVNLRAERSATGGGRVYTITVQCTDASGNSSTETTKVTVPHKSINIIF